MVDLGCSLALLALVPAVWVAWAMRTRRSRPDRHPRVTRAGSSPLLGDRVQQIGYSAMQPLADVCVAMGLDANGVSLASLAFAGAAGIALGTGHFGVGAALGVVSSVGDAVDGMVARRTGTASEAGEVLDATVDRYAELFFIGGVAYHLRADAGMLLLSLAAAAGATMVSYATAKAEALQVNVPRGIMRRQERAAYLALGAALVPIATAVASAAALPRWVGIAPMLLGLGLVAVCGNLSAVFRLRAVATRVAHRERLPAGG